MLKRSELVKKLRESMVFHTNKKGYLDITDEIISDVLKDIESLINVSYAQEEEVDTTTIESI